MLNMDQRLPLKAARTAFRQFTVAIRKAGHRLFLGSLWIAVVFESGHNLKIALHEGLTATVTPTDWEWVEAAGLCSKAGDHSAQTMLDHGLCALLVCLRTMIDYFAHNWWALFFLIIAVIETYRRLRRAWRTVRLWRKRGAKRAL